MTWNAFHRRGDVLREVVRAADQRLDGHLPTDVPGVAETFADDVDLVGALLLKWHARLSGNLERALGAQPMDLPGAVANAWRRTAEEMPGVRLVVDRATELPRSEEMRQAMARARHRERVRLAQAAGLAGTELPRNGRAERQAADAGRRIEERARLSLPRARAGQAPAVRPTSRPEARPAVPAQDRASFVARIKAVLAA